MRVAQAAKKKKGKPKKKTPEEEAAEEKAKEEEEAADKAEQDKMRKRAELAHEKAMDEFKKAEAMRTPVSPPKYPPDLPPVLQPPEHPANEKLYKQLLEQGHAGDRVFYTDGSMHSIPCAAQHAKSTPAPHHGAAPLRRCAARQECHCAAPRRRRATALLHRPYRRAHRAHRAFASALIRVQVC